mmetsp:Transcript_16451/g.57500  ORF Transcript_16451/g.57500 Transcript_16451/m.57500 type:complete len:275 (-) Transcript_16451:4117-4941(-)
MILRRRVGPSELGARALGDELLKDRQQVVRVVRAVLVRQSDARVERSDAHAVIVVAEAASDQEPQQLASAVNRERMATACGLERVHDADARPPRAVHRQRQPLGVARELLEQRGQRLRLCVREARECGGNRASRRLARVRLLVGKERQQQCHVVRADARTAARPQRVRGRRVVVVAVVHGHPQAARQQRVLQQASSALSNGAATGTTRIGARGGGGVVAKEQRAESVQARGPHGRLSGQQPGVAEQRKRLERRNRHVASVGVPAHRAQDGSGRR